MVQITDLVGLGANVKLEVSPSDLQMFAESIVERTLELREQQAKAAPVEEETYYNTREVRDILGVCEGTLNTWAKRGYLVPVKIGNKNRYAKSAVMAIKHGPRAESVSEYAKRQRLNGHG